MTKEEKECWQKVGDDSSGSSLSRRIYKCTRCYGHGRHKSICKHPINASSVQNFQPSENDDVASSIKASKAPPRYDTYGLCVEQQQEPPAEQHAQHLQLQHARMHSRGCLSSTSSPERTKVWSGVRDVPLQVYPQTSREKWLY